MSPLLIGLFIVGLFAASLLWNLSAIGTSRHGVHLDPVCTGCTKPLKRTSWLPLYGFLTAWRCPSCQLRQSSWRFVWDIGVALYFALLGWKWDDSRALAFALISAIPLLLILVIDLRGNVLYLNSIVLALVVAFTLGLIDGPRATGSVMLGLIAGVAISAAFFSLSRWVFRSMNFRVSAVGVGDIYIAAAVGAIVRSDGIFPALAFAVILAVIVSVMLPLFSKDARTRATAYGPFLCMGGLLTLLR